MTREGKASEDRSGEEIGRLAESPRKIPAFGWSQILMPVLHRISGDNISMVAAGVAFYGPLAVFPGFAAPISLVGLVADAVQVETQLPTMSPFLPADVYLLLSEQMREVTSGSNPTLDAGLAGAILLSVWSATRGTRP